MDDVGLDITSPQPAWRPETITMGFKDDGNMLDRSSRLPAFCFPRCRNSSSIFPTGTVFFSRWRPEPTHQTSLQNLRVPASTDSMLGAFTVQLPASALWDLSSSLSLASLSWKREGVARRSRRGLDAK